MVNEVTHWPSVYWPSIFSMRISLPIFSGSSLPVHDSKAPAAGKSVAHDQDIEAGAIGQAIVDADPPTLPSFRQLYGQLAGQGCDALAASVMHTLEIDPRSDEIASPEQIKQAKEAFGTAKSALDSMTGITRLLLSPKNNTGLFRDALAQKGIEASQLTAEPLAEIQKLWDLGVDARMRSGPPGVDLIEGTDMLVAIARKVIGDVRLGG
ncbi:MAG: hypothetical protein EOO22_04310 [Comamonadaceae bacterium]|nr:MAG: hypothetical protein EOO22_04310 [Comamonadaceae bacterium]